MYYFAKFLAGMFGMGQVTNIRMVENHGLYKFQRKKTLFGYTWWEFIPDLMSDLQTNDKKQADEYMESFKRQLKREDSEWQIMEEI